MSNRNSTIHLKNESENKTKNHPSKTPLNPNLIKVLIASESSFRVNLSTPTKIKSQGNAYGLMQITDGTLKTLADQYGELRNHLIHIPQEKIFDSSANICAGVRWLFQKKHLADHRLKHESTWIEVIAEYKGILAGYISEDSDNHVESKGVMDKFLRKYNDMIESES